MRRAAISTVLLALSLLLLAGCGSGDEGKIPAEQGDRMQELTDELAEQVDADRCSDANSTLTDIRHVANEVEANPDVEDAVATTLQDLITRIDQQLDDQCEEPEEEEEEPETTTPETTVPPETFEEPTTTETTEETTTTTTTTQRTTQPPPNQGGTPPGQGGTPPGQGGGGGGGGGTPGGGFTPGDD